MRFLAAIIAFVCLLGFSGRASAQVESQFLVDGRYAIDFEGSGGVEAQAAIAVLEFDAEAGSFNGNSVNALPNLLGGRGLFPFTYTGTFAVDASGAGALSALNEVGLPFTMDLQVTAADADGLVQELAVVVREINPVTRSLNAGVIRRISSLPFGASSFYGTYALSLLERDGRIPVGGLGTVEFMGDGRMSVVLRRNQPDPEFGEAIRRWNTLVLQGTYQVGLDGLGSFAIADGAGNNQFSGVMAVTSTRDHRTEEATLVFSVPDALNGEGLPIARVKRVIQLPADRTEWFVSQGGLR